MLITAQRNFSTRIGLSLKPTADSLNNLLSRLAVLSPEREWEIAKAMYLLRNEYKSLNFDTWKQAAINWAPRIIGGSGGDGAERQCRRYATAWEFWVVSQGYTVETLLNLGWAPSFAGDCAAALRARKDETPAQVKRRIQNLLEYVRVNQSAEEQSALRDEALRICGRSK